MRGPEGREFACSRDGKIMETKLRRSKARHQNSTTKANSGDLNIRPKKHRSDMREHALKVVAKARTLAGDKWHHVLEFFDHDGRKQQLPVPCSKAHSGTALFDLLEDHGYAVPTTPQEREQLRNSIVNSQPTRRMLIIERPGWHDRAF